MEVTPPASASSIAHQTELTTIQPKSLNLDQDLLIKTQ